MITLEDHDVAHHECRFCKRTPRNQRSLQEIQDGADSGCIHHQLVKRCVDWAIPKFLDVDLETIRSGYVDASGDVTIHYLSDEGKEEALRLQCLKTNEGTGRLTSFAGHEYRQLPASTSSESTFEVIKHWFEECLATHEDCPKTHRLDSSEDSLEEVRFLQIFQKSVTLREDILPDRYACLSHCWGNGYSIPKTEQHNISVRKEKGLAVEDLPRTFQDAVTICQKLGIEYLWIDSLCIIQNDPIDWMHQAAGMADIYEHAFVTIAAGKSKDSTGGCFCRIHESLQGERLLGYNNIHVHRKPDNTGNKGTERSWTQLTGDSRHRSPLLHRAWVFQEVAVSPRILMYGDQGLNLICWSRKQHQSNASEPQGLNLTLSQHLRNAHRLYRVENRPGEEEHMRDLWHGVVTAYSWRHLSFDKDRLPAIAAVAKRMMQLRIHDMYLAGLWKSTILFDLMWEKPQKGRELNLYKATPLDATLRVPTWSWAYLFGLVVWNVRSTWKPLRNVQVLETVYETDGPAISGQIKEAYIKLKAPLIKLSGLRLTTDLSNLIMEAEEASAGYAGGNQYAKRADVMSEIVISALQWDLEEDQNNILDDKCYALPLISDSSPFGKQKAIVLRETDTEHSFRRFGIVELDNIGGYYTELRGQMIVDTIGVNKEITSDAAMFRRALNEFLESFEAQIVTLK